MPIVFCASFTTLLHQDNLCPTVKGQERQQTCKGITPGWLWWSATTKRKFPHLRKTVLLHSNGEVM